MADYGNPDLYRSPRYPAQVAEALRQSASSAMWDDWDLDGLLTDIPHAFAKKMGAENGIFCSTGTAGLHASLMALELLPGDEVIVPCMTFIRSVTPLVHLGLIPVLVDIDPDTGNLDPKALQKAISPKTRAVIVVHMWGIPADMDAISAICRDFGIYLIEDFSHAHFTAHTSGIVGSFGDVAFASLQRKKTFSVGEGGLIVTRDRQTYERLRQITSPGSFKNTPNYNEFSGFGLNLRMSPFSCVVARELLSLADQIVADRATHALEFSKMLEQFGEWLEPPYIPSYARVVSAYGYKPKLTNKIALEKLRMGNGSGLWRFGIFSYDSILSSPFWRKSRAHYPFAQQIRPIPSGEFVGYSKYVKSRVSLAVPTITASYWSDETRSLWMEDLEKRIKS